MPRRKRGQINYFSSIKAMNKPSLKAYLDVIQGLLSCPQGEEWILLRQHEKLVNL